MKKFFASAAIAVLALIGVIVVAPSSTAAQAPVIAPAEHEYAFGPFGSVRNNNNGSGAWVRAYDNRAKAVRYDTRLCEHTYRFVYPGTQTDPYYDADCLSMRSRYGDQVTGIVVVINIITGERLWTHNFGCNRGSLNDFEVGFNGLERAYVNYARKCA